MSEVIVDAEQMMAMLKKHHFKGIKDLLATAPEFLRCEDCVNCITKAENGNRPMCALNVVYVKEDGGCTYGERKDDD